MTTSQTTAVHVPMVLNRYNETGHFVIEPGTVLYGIDAYQSRSYATSSTVHYYDETAEPIRLVFQGPKVAGPNWYLIPQAVMISDPPQAVPNRIAVADGTLLEICGVIFAYREGGHRQEAFLQRV